MLGKCWANATDEMGECWCNAVSDEMVMGDAGVSNGPYRYNVP